MEKGQRVLDIHEIVVDKEGKSDLKDTGVYEVAFSNKEFTDIDEGETIIAENEIFIRFKQECIDEVIGIIDRKDDEILFTRRDDYSDTFVSIDNHDRYIENVTGRVVMILESPHVDEFGMKKTKNGPIDEIFGIKNLHDIDGNKITSRPANGVNGKTGINIEKYFGDVLDLSRKKIIQTLDLKKGEQKRFSFSIINSITFQCSLGYDTNAYRDEIFLNMIARQDIKDYLIKRISRLNPSLIINACTVGNNKHKIVGGLLKDSFKSSKQVIVKGVHPSRYQEMRIVY